MITIRYDRKKHSVTAKGHACSGEAGRDLVCSAVTALVATLAADVDGLFELQAVRSKTVRLGSGDAEVSCRAAAGQNRTVTLVFDSICNGLSMLADQYKDHITMVNAQG